MKRLQLCLVCLIAFACQQSTKELSGPDLIQKSIAYHDPNGVWPSLEATFYFTDSLPAPRVSRTYTVSFQNELSKMVYKIEGLHYIVWQDSVQIFEGEVEKEQALRMRNYYSYLWGLPMKLADPGTQIEQNVGEETIDGVSYYVVRVPYEKDIWYFYLDQKNYRMAAYKFYQDEPNQKGEIIYLEGEKEFEGMKIPANRTWYRTEKPEFLATDMLEKVTAN